MSAANYTSLGMHFVNVSKTEVATVLVEVNVRGLISLHARRLCKSKRGMACISSGTVRLKLATPADQELAHAEWRRESEDALTIQQLKDQQERLYVEITRLRMAAVEARA